MASERARQMLAAAYEAVGKSGREIRAGLEHVEIQAALRAIESALASQAPAPREQAEAWQPIEGAPRDGTWFLACATAPGWGATRIVRFADPDDRLPINGEGNAWPSPPTHYMPLPAPPAIAQEKPE